MFKLSVSRRFHGVRGFAMNSTNRLLRAPNVQFRRTASAGTARANSPDCENPLEALGTELQLTLELLCGMVFLKLHEDVNQLDCEARD